MPEYRQNTAYQEIENVESEIDNETEGNSGNTGLPFGLCKKYGIPLPTTLYLSASKNTQKLVKNNEINVL